jgi:hypothetical protein
MASNSMTRHRRTPARHAATAPGYRPSKGYSSFMLTVDI